MLDAAAPLFAVGREVVLVGHSYGGVVATVTSEGQGVAERAARGELGGFSRIVFLAGFTVPVRGWDMLKVAGGRHAPCVEAAEPYTKVSRQLRCRVSLEWSVLKPNLMWLRSDGAR
jgi:pimeloyl-ACP methyl ester carboxylesterase